MSRKGMLCFALPILAGFILTGTLNSQTKRSSPPSPTWVSTETLIGAVNLPDEKIESLFVSPDSRHVAHVERVGSRQVVVVDGKRSPDYPILKEDSLAFSPDSQHFAYVAWDGKNTRVILDGEPLQPLGDILLFPRFSPDSKHVAFGATQKDKSFVVLDGKPGQQFDSLKKYSLTFSPDSQHLAYVAINVPSPGQWQHFVVLDGKEGPHFSQIESRLRFSLDSNRLAYSAGIGMGQTRQFVVVDGVTSPEYRDVGLEPRFSPDSQRIYYPASDWDNHFLVVDGKPGEKYALVLAPAVSPDSQHIAYIAGAKEKQFVVLDGKPGDPYEKIVTIPLFSSDSQHIVYLATDAGKTFAVVDGIAGKKYDEFWNHTLHYSPDGKRLGYIVKQNGKWVAVIDGKEGLPHDYGTPTMDAKNKINGWKNEREKGFLAFSPDSKRVAYLAQYGRLFRMNLRNGNQVMTIAAGISEFALVTDAREGPKYSEIPNGSIRFSPDGRHLVYAAKKGSKWFVVTDDKQGTAYDSVLVHQDSPIIFNAPDTFHYLAINKGNLYQVTSKWSPAPAPIAKPMR